MDIKPADPMKQSSGDTWVRVAAYAAFAVAGVSAAALALTVIYLMGRNDPTQEQFLSAVQTAHALAVGLAWGLLFPVAVGLYRLDTPSTMTSKLGLVLAGFGGAAATLGTLVYVAGVGGADFLAPYDFEAGEMAVGIWLFLANRDLQRRGVLSRGLAQVGMLFGIAAAITVIALWLNQRYLNGGLFVIAGFLVWPTWLGVVLLRRVPVAEARSALES